MPSAGGKHCARSGVAGPRPHAGGAAAVVAREVGAISKGAIVASAARRVSAPAEAVLGATLVGSGVFLRDGGRGGREDDHGIHREPTLGRGRGRVQDYRAPGALSRRKPGILEAA